MKTVNLLKGVLEIRPRPFRLSFPIKSNEYFWQYVQLICTYFLIVKENQENFSIFYCLICSFLTSFLTIILWLFWLFFDLFLFFLRKICLGLHFEIEMENFFTASFVAFSSSFLMSFLIIFWHYFLLILRKICLGLHFEGEMENFLDCPLCGIFIEFWLEENTIMKMHVS